MYTEDVDLFNRHRLIAMYYFLSTCCTTYSLRIYHVAAISLLANLYKMVASSVGGADVSPTRRFADRRFADKLFDPETFRRHGSDVSPTHFGRLADNPSDVSPTNS